MRKSKLLLALMAGATLLAFLPLDDAASQPIDVEVISVELHITRMDETYRDAVVEHQAGQCDDFEDSLSDLRFYTRERFISILEVQKVAPDDVTRALNHANQLLDQLAALGPCERKSAISISAGGGGSIVDVPQIPIGTQFVDDRGTFVTETDDELTGGSFDVNVTAPVGGEYQGYVNYQFTEADGSSRGSVAPGGNDVAITFPVLNPEDDSTDIFLADRGLNVTTDTDFEMNDVSFGFGGAVDLFGPSVVTNVLVGGRYINVDRTDRISQTTPAFDDVFMNTHIGQDTNFFGPQFGVTIDNLPPPGGGFIYGVGGSVSFLDTDTDANVRSLIRSPGFDGTLTASPDRSTFSLALDGEAHVGYRFGENFEIRIIGSVTHFADMPVIHLPVSPVDSLRIDEDDLTSWDILFGTTLRFP